LRYRNAKFQYLAALSWLPEVRRATLLALIPGLAVSARRL
jgi:hypothetical protein